MLAVAVAEPLKVFGQRAHTLASELVQHSSRAAAFAQLEIERRYLGEGYGHATNESQRAMREAARVGLILDHTYTAKAFAAALDLDSARRCAARVVLEHALQQRFGSPF